MPPLRTFALVLVAALAGACSGGAGARTATRLESAPVAPLRVSCGPLAECASKAAALCPTGYQLVGFGRSAWADADPSIARDRTERGQMFVRCTA